VTTLLLVAKHSHTNTNQNKDSNTDAIRLYGTLTEANGGQLRIEMSASYKNLGSAPGNGPDGNDIAVGANSCA
jgi:hypothetical protein